MPAARSSLRSTGFSRRAKTILAIGLLALLIFVAVLSFLAYHAEPLLRARIIDTLSARFHSRVDLAELKVSVSRGLVVSGKGLMIYGQTDPNIHRNGIQPLIGVDEFRFHASVLSLLRSPMHVGTVYIKGLELNIPPKQDREQLQQIAPKGGKIKILVDEFHSEKAELIINTSRPDKLPLEFDIQDLRMKDIGPDRPLPFTATLVNPRPVGDIQSKGEFGPFHAEDPRDSPVRGEYTFSKADLGTLKGISGTLSSTGRYEGTLGEIVVDGETDTPDFRLDISGRPVPLKTRFHAVVDGTSGDTYLKPVRATILSTPLIANGFVVKSVDLQGHHIHLDVTVPTGKIEDLMRLASRSDPLMTGSVRLKTKLDLPPGQRNISERLYLKGSFQVNGVHFTREEIQSKLDALSMRSRGKPAKDDVQDNVRSEMEGHFVLKNAIVNLPDLSFRVPGTRVTLAGTYSLEGDQFDFAGVARFDAKLSQMVGGWKSIFLKPVDPFFSKHGSGTELPIKVTGTRSEPHIALNFGRKHRTEAKVTSESVKAD